MAKTVKIEVKDQDLLASLSLFFKTLLQQGGMRALLLPQRLPMEGAVMPTLVADPERLDGADPIAPAFPINAARMVSRLTRRPIDGQVAAVLRPCEIRAFIELVKLKQGRMEDLILVGMDCLGAYSNVNYQRYAAGTGKESSLRFIQSALSEKGTAWEDFDISPACKACEHPVPENADLAIGLIGVDVKQDLLIKANTPKEKRSFKSWGSLMRLSLRAAKA
jgi:formate dehydrogenase subunit beta